MKELDDKHWTEDPERIERYILNRLNADERNELEDHLRVCEICKRAVHAEQVLVAGIRRSGRDAFKVQLQHKLAEIPEQKTPWVQILSAAAVVVILLTVAVYNRWFETQTSKPVEPVTITQEQAQAERSDEKDERSLAKQEPSNLQTPVAAAPEQKKLLADEKKKAKSEGERNIATTPIGGNVANEDAAGGQAAQQSENLTDVATQPSLAAIKEARGAENRVEPTTVWLEGKVLESSIATERQNLSADKREVGTGTYGFGKPAEPKAKAEAPLGVISLDQVVNNTRITLNQEMLSPTQQHQRSQQRLTSSVPAQITRRQDKIEVTLFLDSLIDKNEFAKATIEDFSNDTLVVRLQNQRIIYRIPAEWNSGLQAKPTK